ncbi:DUF1510 family protein [Virgibacillus kekensis]|uniref:DUF1510 family protein n=1 Tax=Virgibacillus kekensis TaxID=202261 RepID=A0ABV9DMV9_9BACI
MSDFTNNSRVDKFEKRRKNTKSLSVLLILGSILLVVLIGVMVFGGDESAEQPTDEKAGQTTGQDGQAGNSGDDEAGNTDEEETDENNAQDDSTGESDTEENNTQDNESDAQSGTEQVEPSDDNVTEAYTKDWQPVGTEQSEPHTTNFDEGSQDRLEMRKASAVATGLDEESLIMWWIQRNGDNSVISTVSNADNTEYYRVYMTWVENQGWKPSKVEVLKENDQEWRFE